MRREVTPRVIVNQNLKDKIGCIAISNCFPTFRGRLLYIHNEKCYFELQKHPDYPQFDMCEGQIEYLPEDMVRSINFED